MIHLSWLDFALRHLPEGFIIILAGYAISKKHINVKLFILSSVLLGLLNFFIKILPISSIFHMVLSIIAAIAILMSINKIKTLYAILSTIICFMITIITEAINMLILSKIFHLDTARIFQESTPFVKNLYGLPSLILLGVIVVAYYFISKKKKNVTNKKISK